MKLKSRAKLFLCGLMSVITVLTLHLFSTSAHALEPKEDHEMQITPTKTQIGALNPGDTYTGTLDVINSGREPFKYKVYATGYQVTNENYDAMFSDGNYTKISKWITFDKTTGSINSGETQTIKYTVKVPSDAAGGGQYAAIMVETIPDSAEGEASVTSASRLGMILYSHVNGQVVTCSKVASINVNTFLVAPPISATSLVENCGNIDLDAKYIMRVFPLFSNEEIYTNEEDPESLTILPETKRFNNSTWKNSPSFGIFRVEHEVQIGDQKQSATQYVIICPIWLIVIILLFIGSIVFWFFARRRERKDAAEASKASATKDTKKDDKSSDK